MPSRLRLSWMSYALCSIDCLISDSEVDTSKDFDYDIFTPMKGVLKGAAKQALTEFIDGMNEQIGTFNEDDEDEDREPDFMPCIALADFESPLSRISGIPAGTIMGSFLSQVGNSVFSGLSRKPASHDVVPSRDDAYTRARSAGLVTNQAAMMKMVCDLLQAPGETKANKLAQVMVSKHGEELKRIGKLLAVRKIEEEGTGVYAMRYLREWAGEQTEARVFSQSEMWSRWVSVYKARSEDTSIDDATRYDFFFRYVGIAAWVAHVGKDPGRMWAATLIAMAHACASLGARTGVNTRLDIEEVVRGCTTMFSSKDAGAERMRRLVMVADWREFRQKGVVSDAIARAIGKVWRFFVCRRYTN